MKTCAGALTLALAIVFFHAPPAAAGATPKANHCESFMSHWPGAGQVIVIQCQGNVWIHPVVMTEPEDQDGGDAGSAFTSLGRPLFNYQYANRQERGEHTVTRVGKFTYDKKQKRWELPINTRSEDWFRGEHLVEKAKLVIYWNAASRAFAME